MLRPRGVATIVLIASVLRTISILLIFHYIVLKLLFNVVSRSIELIIFLSYCPCNWQWTMRMISPRSGTISPGLAHCNTIVSIVLPGRLFQRSSTGRSMYPSSLPHVFGTKQYLLQFMSIHQSVSLDYSIKCLLLRNGEGISHRPWRHANLLCSHE